MTKVKTYDELTFTDDFMFCKVLEGNPELCKELIELILDTRIEVVSEIGKQHPIEITPDGRGVRLMSVSWEMIPCSIWRCRMQTGKTCPAEVDTIRT